MGSGHLLKQNPHSPDIATLTKEIYKLIDDQRTETWRTTVTELGNQCSSKLFKLLKRMSGQGQASSNQAIKFKGKYVSNPKKIASGFNQQYSAVIQHKSSKESRRISKDIWKRKLVEAPTFTPSQTQEAIKKSKNSKALGPDKISSLHLKHLGQNGIDSNAF